MIHANDSVAVAARYDKSLHSAQQHPRGFVVFGAAARNNWCSIAVRTVYEGTGYSDAPGLTTYAAAHRRPLHKTAL